VINVPSWRAKASVEIKLPDGRVVIGDVAWGGNWFFLVRDHPEALTLSNVERLTDFSWQIRQAVNSQGFPEVDHVELFGPGMAADANSRNFVLCPGKAYDRSPCGTGSSAKLACLAADGKLKENEIWTQESIIGSCFKGSFAWLDRATGKVAPRITGKAFVNAESTLLLDDNDPFCWGIGNEQRA
jgi:4-hydroxyproline epimerase